MAKISPCLWFDGQAEQAATFYVSVLKNSRILEISRFGEGGPAESGSVLTVSFEIEGQQFVALNGGPQFTFSEAISFQISCADQHEVDDLWEKLSEGGEEGECGWLKDRFGVSWQIIPTALSELLGDPDPGRAQRALQAMLSMRKIDIAALRAAADGA